VAEEQKSKDNGAVVAHDPYVRQQEWLQVSGSMSALSEVEGFQVPLVRDLEQVDRQSEIRNPKSQAEEWRGGVAMSAFGREFYVIIERDEDGYYVGEVPQLRACYSQGRTLDELMANIREVIELCLEEERVGYGHEGQGIGRGNARRTPG